ncbi:MAG: Methyltransferase type 11 [Gemmatimonadetes bacterium]|jgi:2-polyprenyl-3-methyl-5-hydroxy-6-metoxy-1,4-benzoquinol methylase|nr:Methyltransferase type 11 [Gemmatimonadota bacterium]
MLTPRRRRGFEHLDDPAVDDVLRERSLRDVRRANTVLGGRWAVLSEVRRVLDGLAETSVTLMDVGTGLADIPSGVRRLAKRRGVRLVAYGVDEAVSLARVSAGLLDASICADARRLPFADGSVDIVTCSQVLHHFEDAEIPAVLRELTRVARRAVIVSDLRRSWLAAAGFWLVTWPLGFHPVSRHDGLTSVLRGFTPAELRAHARALGQRAEVRRHPGFRVTATWSPSPPGT